jgi:hypothetical protein
MFAAAAARAQSGPNVTLQLPSFSSIGVDTTVLVPDRGATTLGAQRQARYGSSTLGPPPQRTLVRSQISSAVQVTAQVHDPRAAEADLLRAARERRATWQRGSLSGRNPAPKFNSESPLLSVAEIRRRQTAAKGAQNSEAARLLQEARRARAAGQSGAAAVYYEMAARRAEPANRAAIMAEASRGN